MECGNLEANRKAMVEMLKSNGYIRSRKLEEAMLTIPRELFVSSDEACEAYDDRPLRIEYGQTISAPSVVARMTELLDLRDGMKVLEVGTGSGYQAAVLAYMVGNAGHVWSIERIPELARRAEERLRLLGLSERVTIVVGDGSIGYRDAAPFDRIIVTAAAPKVPKPLIDQLSDGGIMVIPVGSREEQVLIKVVKRGGEVHYEQDVEVLFVPLIGAEGFQES